MRLGGKEGADCTEFPSSSCEAQAAISYDSPCARRSYSLHGNGEMMYEESHAHHTGSATFRGSKVTVGVTTRTSLSARLS